MSSNRTVQYCQAPPQSHTAHKLFVFVRSSGERESQLHAANTAHAEAAQQLAAAKRKLAEAVAGLPPLQERASVAETSAAAAIAELLETRAALSMSQSQVRCGKGGQGKRTEVWKGG